MPSATAPISSTSTQTDDSVTLPGQYRMKREVAKAGNYYLDDVPFDSSSFTCLQCKIDNDRVGTIYADVFPTQRALWTHTTIHHPTSTEVERCLCGQSGTANDLIFHHCSFAAMRCGLCDSCFDSLESCMIHMNHHHRNAAPSWTIVTTVRPSYVFANPLLYHPDGRPLSAEAKAMETATDYPCCWQPPEARIKPPTPKLTFPKNDDDGYDLMKAIEDFGKLSAQGLLTDPPPRRDYHLNRLDSEEADELLVSDSSDSDSSSSSSSSSDSDSDSDISSDNDQPSDNEDPIWNAGHGLFREHEHIADVTMSSDLFPCFHFETPSITVRELAIACSALPEALAAYIALMFNEILASAELVAQGRTTIFAHMQVPQLVRLARHAAHMRRIFRTLMTEEDYWKTDSKFNALRKTLCLDKVPIFAHSQNLIDLTIPTDEGPVVVITSPSDCSPKWLSRATMRTCLRAEGLFDLNITHGLDQTTRQAMTGFIDRATAVLTNMGLALSLIQKLTSAILKTIVMYVSKFDWKVCSLLLLDMLVTTAIPDKLIKNAYDAVASIWAHAASYFTSSLTAEISTDPFAAVVTVSTILLGTVIFGKFPTGASMIGLVTGVKACGDLSRGLKSSWTFVYDLATSLISKLSEHYYGVPTDISELSKYCSDVVGWYADCKELIDLHIGQDIKNDPGLCRRIATSYKKGVELSAGLRHVNLPRHAKEGFETHFAMIRDLHKRASQSGAYDTGSRVEPVVVHLSGSSGIGKSGLTPHLAANIIMFDGVNLDENGKHDVYREIYTRNPTQEFWDGYYGQRVVVYDDFAQKVDSAATPNPEFDEIIRTGNLTRYPLHMAHLEDKDNTNFVSRAVILTSNQHPRNLVIRSLNTPQAVLRRLEHCYTVSIDPEVSSDVTHNGQTSQRLDPAKVQEIYGTNRTVEFYRFHKINPETFVEENLPIRYPELLRRIREAYTRKLESFVDTDNWIMTSCDAMAAGQLPGGEAFNHAAPPPPIPNLELPIEPPVEEEEEEFVDADQLQAQLATDITNPELMNTYARELGPGFYTDVNNHMLTDEARLLANTFKDAAVLTEDEMIELLDKWGNTEIVDPQKYQHFIDSWHRSALIAVKAVIPQETNNIMTKIRYASARLTVYIKQLTSKVANIIAEHFKWLPPVLALGGMIYLYRRVTSSHTDPLPVVDAFHFGIFPDDDTEVTHCHKCDFCGALGYHTHRRQAFYDSINTVHLCPSHMHVRMTPYLYESRDIDNTSTRNSTESLYDKSPRIVLHDPRTKTSKRVPKDKAVDQYVKDFEEGKTKVIYMDLQERLSTPHGSSLTGLIVEGYTTTDISLLKLELTPYTGPTVEGSAISPGPQVRKRERGLRTEHTVTPEEMESLRKPLSATAQLADDQNSMDMGVRILKNTYLISAITPTQKRFTVRGVFIQGRTMLTVFHLKTHLYPGTSVHIRNSSIKDGWTIPFESLKIAEVVGPNNEYLDQILIQFPKSVSEHVDLTGTIADTETINKFTTVRAGLCVAVDAGTAVVRTGQATAKHDITYTGLIGDQQIDMKLRTSYEYIGLQNNEGDCGSPLVAMQSIVQKKLIGIHVCGSYGVGYSTALNIDHIRKTMDRMCIRAQIRFEPDQFVEYEELQEYSKLPPGNFQLLGKVPKFVGGTSYTKLRRSPAHNLIAPSTMAPAKLAPFYLDGELVSPMDNSLAKAGTTTPHLDQTIIDEAVAAVCTAVNCHPSPDYKRVLTEIEAIEGAGENFVAINRTTSPGFPWCLQTKQKPGKTRWLGHDKYEYHPDLKAAVDFRLEKAKLGIRVPAIWVDTLKDEKRPLEKVVIGKTRTISTGAQDYTLLVRRYFGGFAAHVATHRIRNEISVGIDMHDPAEVKRLKDHLTSKGPNVVAGDFSNFDGTLCPQILYGALEVIEDFYQGTDEDRLVRDVLFSEIVNSIHLRDDCLYTWTHSQPSGNPMTSYINSLYNSISMRYVWAITAPIGMKSMVSFAANVAMQSYGDDNVINVSPTCDWFNQMTITEGYKALNMTYTMEDKSGASVLFRTLPEISYLKRSIRKTEEGLWVAPLDLTTILEIGQWVHGDLDPMSLCVGNMANALEELAMHGQTIYDQHATTFRTVARSQHIPLLVPSYREQVDTWKARVGLTKDLVIGAGACHRVTPAAKPDPKQGFDPSGELF